MILLLYCLFGVLGHLSLKTFVFGEQRFNVVILRFDLQGERFHVRTQAVAIRFDIGLHNVQVDGLTVWPDSLDRPKQGKSNRVNLGGIPERRDRS